MRPKRPRALCITHNSFAQFMHKYLYFEDLCSLWGDA